MSISIRQASIARPLISFLALPPTVAHELTHVLASLPWARRVGLVIEPWTGRASARIEWADRAGQGARAISAIAPLVAGTVAASVALALWATTGADLPSSSTALAKVAILTAWWAVYMSPSDGDGNVFWGGESDDD